MYYYAGIMEPNNNLALYFDIKSTYLLSETHWEHKTQKAIPNFEIY